MMIRAVACLAVPLVLASCGDGPLAGGDRAPIGDVVQYALTHVNGTPLPVGWGRTCVAEGGVVGGRVIFVDSTASIFFAFRCPEEEEGYISIDWARYAMAAPDTVEFDPTFLFLDFGRAYRSASELRVPVGADELQFERAPEPPVYLLESVNDVPLPTGLREPPHFCLSSRDLREFEIREGKLVLADSLAVLTMLMHLRCDGQAALTFQYTAPGRFRVLEGSTLETFILASGMNIRRQATRNGPVAELFTSFDTLSFRLR